MSDGDLASRVVPRRAAAKKALELSAAQLESSPPRPEPEERTWPFGEPSKVRSPVKITYGGKGKYRNSPRKSRASSPSPPHVQARTRNRKTPPNSRTLPSFTGMRKATLPSTLDGRPSLTPLSDTESDDGSASPLRGKRAHRVVTNPIEAPSSLSSWSDPDIETTSVSKRPPRHARIGASMSRLGPPKKTPRPAVPLATSNSRKSTPRLLAGRKRSLSPSSVRPILDFDDESVLTPLSSPGPSGSPAPAARARSRSTLTTDPRNSTLLVATQSEGYLANSRPSKARVDDSRSVWDVQTDVDDEWDLDSLGDYVWVKVDVRGHVIEHNDSTLGDLFWWPARIVQHGRPLQLTLFDSPRPSTADNDVLKLHSPSPSNVLSLAYSGTVRFNEITFRQSNRSDSTQASPRKKQKLDIETRWKEARDRMLKADQEDNDGLPMLLSSYVDDNVLSSGGTAGRKRKDKKEKLRQPFSDPETSGSYQRVWRAPSCDPMYEIPGELVLAKEKRKQTYYWPARLLEYIKPQNPKQKPKYRVEFFDGDELTLEPDLFYTTLDPGFKNCRLGEDRLNYMMEDDRDHPDNTTDNEHHSPNLEDESMDESSLPAETPLPLADRFSMKLSITEQFEYVKPVLAAVVEGQYEPAKDRHDAFMRGGRFRRAVCETGYSRGSLRAREVEELLDLVMRWARRWEKRKELSLPLNHVALSHGVLPPSSAERDQALLDDQEHHDHLMPGSQVSVSDAEQRAPSEAEAPPSSAPTDVTPEGTEQKDSTASDTIILLNAPGETVDDQVKGRKGGTAEADMLRQTPVSAVLDSKQDVVLSDEPSTDGDQTSSDGEKRSPVRLTYTDLSNVDKITYCQNILLREAVLQLLLWRSRQRSEPRLLPPEEEQQLHTTALAETEKPYWVHEVIRFKQAAEGKMLPSTREALKPVSGPKFPSGGTRSRPRRG